MATNKRSLVKSLTYKIFGTLVLTSVMYFFMGMEIGQVLQLGSIEFVLKLGLYYAHERLWENIQWGRETVDWAPEKGIVERYGSKINGKETDK